MTIQPQQSIFSEVADFWLSQPTLEAVANYRVSTDIQQHIDDLLDKNTSVGLSTDEHLELEQILAVALMMDIAKAKAKLKLAGKST